MNFIAFDVPAITQRLYGPKMCGQKQDICVLRKDNNSLKATIWAACNTS